MDFNSVRSVSVGIAKPQNLGQVGPRRAWRPLIGAVAAALSTLVLTGCSNSPSNEAARSASSASAKASYLASTAGSFRPAKNFPDRFGVPLTTSELQTRMMEAERNPSAYLEKNGTAFTSRSRDLRHAIALLTHALSDSAVPWNYKEMLLAQRAFCEDQLASLHVEQMRQALGLISRHLRALDYADLHLSHYGQKIAYLKAQKKLYAGQYATQLAAAKTRSGRAATHVERLSKALHRLTVHLAAMKTGRKGKLISGTRLEMTSRLQNGASSLETLKKGTRQLDSAAAMSVPIAHLELQISRLSFVLANAQNMQAFAHDQEKELALQRMVVKKIARRAGTQLAEMQATVHAIIFGDAADHFDVSSQAKALNAALDVVTSQERKAAILYSAAGNDFTMAINARRTAYTRAQTLLGEKMHRSNPMIMALENKNPEALLEIFKAASTLSQAQMLQVQLLALKLQKSAAGLCASAYGLVDKPSPIAAPAAGVISGLQKTVIVTFDNATVSLGQAKAASPDGSQTKWLEPAYQYAVNVGIAKSSTDPSVVAKAEKLAIAAANKANSLNPSLDLSTSFKPQH